MAMTDTVASRLAKGYPAELPTLLRMLGEANMAARHGALDHAAQIAFDTLKLFEQPAPGGTVFDLPVAFGCTESVHAALVAAHGAAMQARDEFYAAEIKPLVDEARAMTEAGASILDGMV